MLGDARPEAHPVRDVLPAQAAPDCLREEQLLVGGRL